MNGVVHISELGLTRAQLNRLLTSGQLTRVCRGWYATPTADPEVVRARSLGGTVTAHSLLKHHAWTPANSVLHVRIDPNWPTVQQKPGVQFHRLPKPATAEENLLIAVLAMTQCASNNDVICVLDSLQERKLVSRVVLEQFALRHRRLQPLVSKSTPLSQSGGESLVRLWFIAHGISFRLQVHIEGVGWVDALVGDCLVVEVDGRAHHLGEQFENDRRRDRELTRRGYIVFRISYRMLYQEWPETEQALLEIIRSGRHRWPRRRNTN